MPQIGDIKRGRQIGHRDGNEYIWHACIDCGKERWVIIRNHKAHSLKCLSCVRKWNKAGCKNKGKPGFRGLSAHLLTGQARINWIAKTRAGKLADKNPQWKGGNVGYFALHEWIKSRLPKPTKCQKCGLNSAFDLANKSGEYKRDLSDWWWICKKCHFEIDGRLHRRNVAGRFAKVE